MDIRDEIKKMEPLDFSDVSKEQAFTAGMIAGLYWVSSISPKTEPLTRSAMELSVLYGLAAAIPSSPEKDKFLTSVERGVHYVQDEALALAMKNLTPETKDALGRLLSKLGGGHPGAVPPSPEGDTPPMCSGDCEHCDIMVPPDEEEMN